MPDRQPDTTSPPAGGRARRRLAALRRWRRLPLAAVAVTYALSWWANAGGMIEGSGPTLAGTAASIAFVGAWLWYAAASVGSGAGGLKLATAYWSVAIVGLVIAGAGVRGQTFGGGALNGWGYPLMGLFYVLGMPIYGLVAWWTVSPRWLVYAAASMACYLLIVASAVRARRPRGGRAALPQSGARPHTGG